jgi:hypothetical protein
MELCGLRYKVFNLRCQIYGLFFNCYFLSVGVLRFSFFVILNVWVLKAIF